jgi:hypothetical protein
LDPPAKVSDNDSNKVTELKMKMSKCETIQEMMAMIKSFMSENNMQSSESSTNSGNYNGSLLNSTESTVFEQSMEMTVFNVLHRPQDSPLISKTPPKGKTPIKSRTSPSTPTGSTARLVKARRNMSAESVATQGCKKCFQLLTSPVKTTAKRMVDKATVMEVEPITQVERKSIETQTDGEVEVKNDNEGEAVKIEPAKPPPPPPPMMMSAPPPPPPPPMMNGLNPPKPPGEISANFQSLPLTIR